MADRTLRGWKESGDVASNPKRVGSNNAHRVESVFVKDRTKILQATQCRLHAPICQISLAIKPSRQRRKNGRRYRRILTS